jgi:DNA-binding LacI/PurR family transcriptional regulator
MRNTPVRVSSGGRPTIKDVAAALGVAISTVSNAYNRPDQLSSRLRDEVFATAARLGYAGPNPAARGLRRQSSGQIGVLLGQPLADAFTDHVNVETLEGIAAVLSASGFGLALVPERARGGLPVTDGLIALSPDRNDPMLTVALQHGTPVVLVDHAGEGGLPAITIGDDVAAGGALRHAAGMGHNRIAIVIDRLGSRSQAGRVRPAEIARATRSRTLTRLQGYRSGAEAAAIAWATIPVYAAGVNTEVAGQAIAELALLDVPTPTLILCTGDRLAAGVLAAAKLANIDVPGRLSVIGFDDTPLARTTDPPLTSIRLPHREKGAAAARTLLASLAGGPIPPPLRVAPKIVVRGSLRGPN